MRFKASQPTHCTLCVSALYVFNSLLSNGMDPVFQHGSSSGYIHHLDGPDFLIAEHHLHAVSDMLTSTTFQAMDVNP